MNVISVEHCVEDALRRDLRGESLFQSVMARISRPGVEVDWGSAPIADPFWHERMTRDERGRKLSGKQIQAAGRRYVIGAWEEHVLRKLEAEELDPQVFTEEATDSYVPLGTLTALDEADGWDVTLAQHVRRKSPETLIRDLEPMLRSLATKTRRAFTLEMDQEDELKQRARIKITDNLGSFEGRSSFSTWAYSVARRTMVDEGRRLSSERRRELVNAVPAEDDVQDDTLPVDDRLALWPVLRDAFLTVPNAELVVLQELGYEDKEISQENIRMKRHRARAKLAETLALDSEILCHLKAPLANPEVVLAHR